MSLSSEEKNNVNGLFKQLRSYDAKNAEKERYYEGKNKVKALGIAIDPSLANLRTAIDWAKTVVDIKQERLKFEGYIDDSNLGLMDIFRSNDLNLQSKLAHTDALVYGMSFVAVGTGSEGESSPLITVESPKRFTADFNLRTRRLDSALSVTRDSKGNPLSGALYLPNETIYLEYFERNWFEVARDVHDLGRVPVAVIRNNPRTGEFHGSSDISNAVREITDSAMRTLQHMEVNSQFYSSPRIIALNAAQEAFEDSDGNPINTFNAIAGNILDFPYNAADKVETRVQQLNANSPAPFIDQIKMYAQLLSQATGIPSNLLGFDTGNPTSAEAITAMETRLIKIAEDKKEMFSIGWLEVARLSLLVRDGSIPEEMSNVDTLWRDPATITRAASADATQKLIASGVLLPDSEVTYAKLGFTDAEKRQLTNEKNVADSQLLVSNLAQAAAAAAGGPVVAGETNETEGDTLFEEGV